MPAWVTTPAPDGHVGRIHHELIGDRIGAIVEVDEVAKRTVINVALVVDGIDEATVQRCKGRAERLLVEAQRA